MERQREEMMPEEPQRQRGKVWGQRERRGWQRQGKHPKQEQGQAQERKAWQPVPEPEPISPPL